MRGTVLINQERCKGCELCVQACPQKVLHLGQDHNARGYRSVVLDSSTQACTGCGICAIVCPDVVFTVFRQTRAKAPLSPVTA